MGRVKNRSRRLRQENCPQLVGHAVPIITQRSSVESDAVPTVNPATTAFSVADHDALHDRG